LEHGINYPIDGYSWNDEQNDFFAMKNMEQVRMYELYIQQYH
jgi:hypothetical protein